MLRLIVCFLIFIFPFNKLLAEDIPIIVISAGKSAQSYSSVGSTVTVIDSETIQNSPNTFLTDLLDSEVGGLNMFQMGGTGTNTGIQIRGLPKRSVKKVSGEFWIVSESITVTVLPTELYDCADLPGEITITGISAANSLFIEKFKIRININNLNIISI